MKLLVTGATGFVGSHLLRALNTGEHAITCVTRQQPASIVQGNIAFVRYADLNHANGWQCALGQSDAVIHLAGRAHVMDEQAADPLAAFRAVNVEQTLALARQAMAHRVRRFIYISSVKVNGEHTADQPFRSTDMPAPQDPYGISKYEAECQLLALAKDRMEVVIIRPPLIYGPGVKANFRQLINAVRRGIPLPFGAVNNLRSLVYVGNLVDLIMTCLQHPHAANRVWMVSDNHDLSTPALIRMLGDVLEVPARLIDLPPGLLRSVASLAGKKAQAEKLLGSLQVDISPTQAVLGWTPPYSVRQGLAITVNA